MVAQQPQLQLQSQQPTPSAQDEALKRNTDCVYFLASPLTCKKGNECEYRHSEYARVNPRDCRYWLSGNCLNPNCSFRHPPLDGLLGTQATTPGGSSVPPPQFPTASAAHSSKQAVPCIFFQKGLCLKGDRCAFSHGPPTPNTVNNKIAAQIPATSLGAENPSFKMPFGSVEKNALEKKIPQGNVAKSVAGPEAKPAQKVETAPLRNMSQLEKKVPQPSAGVDNGASRFKRSSPPVTNGPVGSRSNRQHQARMLDDHNFPGGKDSDDFLRESSPGFDVLVADETRNSDYYHGEDEFGKARVEDKGHGDYNLAADIDRERFHVPQGYESYDHLQDSYGWEQHRRAPAFVDGRTRRRSDSPDNAEVSDLRHHLSKRRKGNGLKSVVSHHYEGHGEEQSHRSHSRKDSLNESSLGSRFRGRIILPANGGGDHLEREGRGGFRSRLSSGVRLPAPHQGRIHDRIQGRVPDDERRSSRERLMGRDLGGDRSDFAGPKSLAELKNGSNTEAKEHHSLGRRRGLRDQPQSDDDFQFEGPKPLSEILREKRGAGAGAGAGAASKNENGSDPVPVRKTENGGLNNEEVPKPQVTDVSGDVDSSQAQLVGETAYHEQPGEDQYYEGDDQREGDYEYEQVDEGYYEYEQGDEGEIQEEEDYMDEEDDGDDFAKKIGVIQP